MLLIILYIKIAFWYLTLSGILPAKVLYLPARVRINLVVGTWWYKRFYKDRLHSQVNGHLLNWVDKTIVNPISVYSYINVSPLLTIILVALIYLYRFIQNLMSILIIILI